MDDDKDRQSMRWTDEKYSFLITAYQAAKEAGAGTKKGLKRDTWTGIGDVFNRNFNTTVTTTQLKNAMQSE